MRGESFDRERGLDTDALRQVGRTARSVDGLVTRATLDSVTDPTKLVVQLADGLRDAESCRFDVRWLHSGFYSFHHTDTDGVNFRYDHHPKDGVPTRHFHPPPDARSDAAEPSCLTPDPVAVPGIVTRGVFTLWRRSYETGRLTALNDAEKPP